MKKGFIPGIIIFMLFTVSAQAATTDVTGQNIFFTAPSLPWIECYENGHSTMSISGAYVMNTGGGNSQKGGMASFDGLFGFNEYVGLDMGFGMLGMGGKVNPYITNGMFMSMALNLNLVLQLFRVDHFSFFLFGGGNVDMDMTDVTGLINGSKIKHMSNSGMFLAGAQAGVQASLKIFGFALTPYFMIDRHTKTPDLESDDSKYKGYKIRFADPSMNMYYGGRISYIPANLTLSFIIRHVPKSSSIAGYDTYFCTVTYNIQIEPPKPVPVEEKPDSEDYAPL